jgi:mono/diheme cytochrome c family protein
MQQTTRINVLQLETMGNAKACATGDCRLSSTRLRTSLRSSGTVPATESAPQGAQPATAQRTSPAVGKAATLSAEAVRGRAIFQQHSCETCHGVDGLHGTVAAPALAGLASILPAPVLENLLRHHSVRMQKGGMPLTNMNTRDMTALVAFIRSMPTPAGAQ